MRSRPNPDFIQHVAEHLRQGKQVQIGDFQKQGINDIEHLLTLLRKVMGAQMVNRIEIQNGHLKVNYPLTQSDEWASQPTRTA